MLIEMMNTIDASPCSAAAFLRWGRHAWVRPSAPHTLTSKILRHLARSTASNGSNVSMRNALLTSTSRRPNSSTVRVDERLHLLGVDEVGRHGQGPAPVGLDLLLDLGEVVGVAGGEHDGGALPGERPGVGLPEARTDPGDDDDLVLEQHPPISGRSRPAQQRNQGPTDSQTAGNPATRRQPTNLIGQLARPGPETDQSDGRCSENRAMVQNWRARADNLWGGSEGPDADHGGAVGRGPEPGLRVGHRRGPGDARPRAGGAVDREAALAPAPRTLHPAGGRVPARRQAARPTAGRPAPATSDRALPRRRRAATTTSD